MIKRFFDWLKQPRSLFVVGIAFLALFSLAAYGLSLNQQSPAQPIQFPHNKHLTLGVQCLYCHPGAAKGASAGIPSEAKCWGCHNQIQKTLDSQLPNTKFPLLKPLVASVESQTPLQWIPVVWVPDFVRFNHRAHIAAGRNCEDCHGDMTKVTVAQNPQTFNMGFCLNCHRKIASGNPELLTKLTDCGTCHY